jgi:hypothetical protein
MPDTAVAFRGASLQEVYDFLLKIDYAQGISPRLHTVLGLTMQAPGNDAVNIDAIQVDPVALMYIMGALENWMEDTEA